MIFRRAKTPPAHGGGAFTVLFDFDGTLADTLALGAEIANRYYEQYRFRRLDKDLVERLRKGTALEALKTVGLTPLTVVPVMRLVRADMHRELERAPFFEGNRAVLDGARALGWRLGILTSNRRANVTAFLATHGLKSAFDFIHTERSVFGKWKAMKRMMKLEGLEPGRTVMVGDELRDLEAAEKSGLSFVGVPWGFNHPDRIESEKPGTVAADGSDLMRRLKALASRSA